MESMAVAAKAGVGDFSGGLNLFATLVECARRPPDVHTFNAGLGLMKDMAGDCQPHPKPPGGNAAAGGADPTSWDQAGAADDLVDRCARVHVVS